MSEGTDLLTPYRKAPYNYSILVVADKTARFKKKKKGKALVPISPKVIKQTHS